jgi:hypothetical protein
LEEKIAVIHSISLANWSIAEINDEIAVEFIDLDSFNF